MIKMSDKQNINEMSLKDVWHDKKLVKNEIIAGTILRNYVCDLC